LHRLIETAGIVGMRPKSNPAANPTFQRGDFVGVSPLLPLVVECDEGGVLCVSKPIIET
jgi:hypothetical protein